MMESAVIAINAKAIADSCASGTPSMVGIGTLIGIAIVLLLIGLYNQKSDAKWKNKELNKNIGDSLKKKPKHPASYDEDAEYKKHPASY